MKKVLVYMANGIGNCVLSIPALKSIKLLDYDVDLAIPKKWNRSAPLIELFGYQDFISDIILKKEDINYKKYEYIFKPNTFKLTDMSIFIDSLPNKIIIENPNWNDTLIHESEYFMQMPMILGFRGSNTDIKIRVKKFQKIDLPAKYIAIAFSCNEGYPWNLKRWPIKYWVDLINILSKKYDCKNFVLIGSKQDTQDSSFIKKMIKHSEVYDLCGKCSILESAYILSKSKFLITIDNGISHLAASSGLEHIVVIYGPTLLSKNIPLGKNVYILRHGECTPCYNTVRFRNCMSNTCMEDLKPDFVADYLQYSSLV